MATANKSGNLYLKLVPIMLSFFAMSFVDLVGTGTNFIKKDFGLSDTMAGLFPLMVFLWFLIFSVPTGLLMNRIGRRKTVLISLVVTALALLLPEEAAEPFAQTLRELSAGRLVPEKVGSVFRGVLRK